MDTKRIAGAVVPPLAGMLAALVLGSLGFGLGCLYADLAAPLPVPIPQVLSATRPEAPTVVAALPAPAVAMGGPEEPVSLRPALLETRHKAETGTAARPLALALHRPVNGGWISSAFGRRLDPFTGQPAQHRGLDFAGRDNSAILAAASGVVTWSGPLRGYGNLIQIDHGRGWVTRYGHNTSNLVRVGDYVKPGQTIALMGATGRATGTHLHFEVLYRGRQQNPARFVPRDT